VGHISIGQTPYTLSLKMFSLYSLENESRTSQIWYWFSISRECGSHGFESSTHSCSAWLVARKSIPTWWFWIWKDWLGNFRLCAILTRNTSNPTVFY
jgi:hypothetical protein